MHRVSKAELSKRGISVEQAAHRLNRSLRGQVVLVDSLNWDGFWIERLFDAAKIKVSSIYRTCGATLPVDQNSLSQTQTPRFGGCRNKPRPIFDGFAPFLDRQNKKPRISRAFSRIRRLVARVFQRLTCLKPGTFEAAIWISLPVWGLRPVRAARALTPVPKPTIDRITAFQGAGDGIDSCVEGLARVAFERSAPAAIAATSSLLFIVVSFNSSLFFGILDG